MRDAANEAVRLLKENGFDIEPADLQALLWYPEKELYSGYGAGSKRSDPTDYHTEFLKIAEEKGINTNDL